MLINTTATFLNIKFKKLYFLEITIHNELK